MFTGLGTQAQVSHVVALNTLTIESFRVSSVVKILFLVCEFLNLEQTIRYLE